MMSVSLGAVTLFAAAVTAACGGGNTQRAPIGPRKAAASRIRSCA